MSIETEEDLAGMRRAGQVVAETLAALKAAVRPGIRTDELDGLAEELLRTRGANSAPRATYAFPGTVCISVNDEAVHGVPGSRTLAPGDLVTLDVTVETGGYYADAAVSVVVPPGTELALRLVGCAEAAFWSGMRAARAGERLARVGGVIEAEVERRGFSVIRELCGHGIGRQLHEEPSVCNFYDPAERRRLSSGLVLAVEPIVSAGAATTRTAADGWTIATADGSLAAHYEHTIVITRGQPIILTQL